MTLSITLPDETGRRLEEAAERLRVPVADLAVAVLRDFLSTPAADFEAAANRVMEKNAALYKRLS
jgi:hypothetical protein